MPGFLCPGSGEEDAAWRGDGICGVGSDDDEGDLTSAGGGGSSEGEGEGEGGGEGKGGENARAIGAWMLSGATAAGEGSSSNSISESRRSAGTRASKSLLPPSIQPTKGRDQKLSTLNANAG